LDDSRCDVSETIDHPPEVNVGRERASPAG
jgi:hypothetical protein